MNELRYKSGTSLQTLLHFYRGQIDTLFWALLFYSIKHSTANRNMEAGLRSTLAWRLQHLSMDFHFRTSTGTLQSKLLRDVEMIEQLTRQLFETIPVTMMTLVIALIATAVRAPLFLVFFLIVIPLTVFLVFKMRRPIENRNRNFRREIEHMSSRLVEMIHLIPVTRAHGVEEDELRRVDARLEQVRETGMRLDKINALFGASSWVILKLGNTLCLITAAYFAFKGRLDVSVGDVVLLTGYFNTITASVSQIIGMLPQIAKGFESVHSLAEVLESPDLEHNEKKPAVDNVRGHFRFEGVTFSYPDADEHSIEDFSLDVAPGETIAFVGQSGAGKSTLLNLIIGFIRPSGGRILLDDVDMDTLDLRTYRHHLSVVAQNTILFKGTVRDNILYGTDNVSEAALWQAIRDANAADFINDLPQGLETVIGDDGARLSGGQRQRIAIARALIRDPRVLILDEATSALDTASEVQIQHALERLMHNRTTFIVAHRLSTIRHADRIVVLDHGQIVAVGTHADLLASGGMYADLHHASVV